MTSQPWDNPIPMPCTESVAGSAAFRDFNGGSALCLADATHVWVCEGAVVAFRCWDHRLNQPEGVQP